MLPELLKEITPERFAMAMCFILVFKVDKTVAKVGASIELLTGTLTRFMKKNVEKENEANVKILKYEVLSELRKQKKFDCVEVRD